MLQIRDLSYSIGDRQLLDNLTWMIQPGKRTALIGANGAGKTTLLRILIGELEYHTGTIVKPKDYRIGYLPQEEIMVTGNTVLQAVLDGQKEIVRLQEQIEELHEILKNTAESENKHELLTRLGYLEHRYGALDGYHLEPLAKKILSGLGFLEADFWRPMTEFSGGWRMRIYLAILLVQKPDLLLLDEPTNHLDLPALEWLEQYLIESPSSVILVTHDRFFIDRISQEIMELERGKLESYSGNYHFYETLKEQKESLQLKKWKEHVTEKERQEKFINRFRYKASKAKQVQSRIKQLEKMDDLDIQPPPPQWHAHMDFKLSVEVTSYHDVLLIRDMYFKYGLENPWVLKNSNISIYRGDKACLVGPNGVGKTTLTRLMVGQLEPQAGSVTLGERTKVGYYAQHQVDTLNLEATVYEEVASTVATALVPKIRDVLGVFQFTGPDVNKKIKVLSGGEKARVSLAKILISPVNFLIMDEPTNHLDKIALQALEKALASYSGTLLLISHDRYFLDKLVNRVIEIRDGTLIEYDGNYSYFMQKRDQVKIIKPPDPEQIKTVPSSPTFHPQSPTETLAPPIPDPTLSLPAAKKSKEQKRLEAEARQSISKERNRLQIEVQQLETKIDRLEKNKTTLEHMMTLPEIYANGERMVQAQKEYAAANKELVTSNQRWEAAVSELDEILQSISSR